ncbi:hypothetical protein [Nocardioides sp. W7]|uniref:hypothetical protein n=1 Tax=Nocardioides sp. W7 TaxID=2931390 RepID=UPI001FD48BF1|nr:hypothetical protein [Nocardioides sp. W7]
MRILTALALLLLPLAACGTEQGAEPPAAEPVGEELLTTSYPVTVIDDGDGAELCLGAVGFSLPPQCDGPRLVGWDWADHAGRFEEAGGTRWGEFVVTGTYDGETMTPTEVVAAAVAEERPEIDVSALSASPCPEPAGGWPVHPDADQQTVSRAFAAARRLEGYADAWQDRSRDPRTPEQVDQQHATGAEDVSLWTVNVRVTGDPAAAEARLREVWQGALCVTRAEHTERELRRIQRRLGESPGLLSIGVGGQQVQLGVIHDDGSLQQRLDEQYGDGLVDVWSALQPVD